MQLTQEIVLEHSQNINGKNDVRPMKNLTLIYRVLGLGPEAKVLVNITDFRTRLWPYCHILVAAV